MAFIQQSIVLGKDETEMESLANEPNKKKGKNVKATPEAEVVEAAVAVKPEPSRSAQKKAAKSKKSGAKRKKKS